MNMINQNHYSTKSIMNIQAATTLVSLWLWREGCNWCISLACSDILWCITHYRLFSGSFSLASWAFGTALFPLVHCHSQHPLNIYSKNFVRQDSLYERLILVGKTYCDIKGSLSHAWGLGLLGQSWIYPAPWSNKMGNFAQMI